MLNSQSLWECILGFWIGRQCLEEGLRTASQTGFPLLCFPISVVEGTALFCNHSLLLKGESRINVLFSILKACRQVWEKSSPLQKENQRSERQGGWSRVQENPWPGWACRPKSLTAIPPPRCKEKVTAPTFDILHLCFLSLSLNLAFPNTIE